LKDKKIPIKPLPKSVLDDKTFKNKPKEGTNLSWDARLKQIEEKFDILTATDKKFKDKRFRLKWKHKRHLKTLARKDKVLVFMLTTNRTIKPFVAQIQHEYIVVNGVYHKVTNDFIYMYEGKAPSIILPEWSLIPIGTKDYYEQVEDGTAAATAQKIIIQAFKMAEVGMGKKLSGKAIIWIFIGAIVVGYVLFSGGGK